jgi:hypothetical protein
MWSRSRLVEPSAAGALLLLAGAAVLAPTAEASSFDPTLAQEVALGPPAGSAPMEGLDARNTGQSRTPFPASPAVGFRTRLPHGIAHAPATDDRGRIVIAHSLPRISEYDRSGKLLWTLRTSAEPAAGPAILSDRTRLFVTTNAELVGVSPAGVQRFRHLLPIGELRSPPLIVALADGGAALSNGHDVLRIDRSGQVTARDRLNFVRSLVEWRGELFAVTDSGDIQRLRAVTGFTLIASFGGRTPEGGAVSREGVFRAVVDEHRLVDLELSTLNRKVRFFDSSLTLAGPPVVLDGGETRTVAAEGVVLGHDRSGTDSVRVALQARAPSGSTAPEPRPVADAGGTLVVARRGQEVALVGADGRTTIIDGTACAEPLRPTPLAPSSLLLACRSGQIWRVDPAPKTR